MQTTSRTPRKRTGPKPSFDKQDVIHEALKLGLDRFTMSEIANRLGVATSALYRICSTKTLLDFCLEQAAERFPFSPTGDWHHLVRDYARSTWLICENYPGVENILLTNPRSHRHFEKHLAAFVSALIAEGFSADEARNTVEMVATTTVSIHLAARAYRLAEERVSPVDPVKGVYPESFPLPAHEEEKSWSHLNDKIDLIIDGLSARRAAAA